MTQKKFQKLIAITLTISIIIVNLNLPVNAFNQVAVPKPNTTAFPVPTVANYSKTEPVSIKSMTSEIKEFLNPNSANKTSKDGSVKTQLSSYSGMCGNNVTWDFQPSTGKLTVSGSGEMFSYANIAYTPWSSLKSSITSVEIKEGIASIGAYAFSYCDNLESVTIPDSVINIGNYAFAKDSNLVSVTIGKKVRNIGECAFGYCSKLQSISLPDSLVSIETSAFIGCSNLPSISFKNGLKTIGNHAFALCDSLTSISIPSSVTLIGGWAFHLCSNLRSVTLGSNVYFLGEASFAECGKLSSFRVFRTYLDGADHYASQWINCNDLQSITVPSNYQGTSFYGKSVVKSSNLLSWDGGDNIGYILDTNSNTLTVSGFGQMFEYDEFPWDSYKSTINLLKKVNR